MFFALFLVACLMHQAFSTCTYKGKTYQDGERFKPSPCEPCFCSKGHVACAIMDCAMAMCVDAVRQPDQCCFTCPNGHNCKYGSTVIKVGDVYRPDANTECTCPNVGFGFGFGAHAMQALCKTSSA